MIYCILIYEGFFLFPEKGMYRIILQKDSCYFYDLNNKKHLATSSVCVWYRWVYTTIHVHVAYHSIYVEVRRQLVEISSSHHSGFLE